MPRKSFEELRLALEVFSEGSELYEMIKAGKKAGEIITRIKQLSPDADYINLRVFYLKLITSDDPINITLESSPDFGLGAEDNLRVAKYLQLMVHEFKRQTKLEVERTPEGKKRYKRPMIANLARDSKWFLKQYHEVFDGKDGRPEAISRADISQSSSDDPQTAKPLLQTRQAHFLLLIKGLLREKASSAYETSAAGSQLATEEQMYVPLPPSARQTLSLVAKTINNHPTFTTEPEPPSNMPSASV